MIFNGFWENKNENRALFMALFLIRMSERLLSLCLRNVSAFVSSMSWWTLWVIFLHSYFILQFCSFLNFNFSLFFYRSIIIYNVYIPFKSIWLEEGENDAHKELKKNLDYKKDLLLLLFQDFIERNIIWPKTKNTIISTK
jgi:hypothetical protein